MVLGEQRCRAGIAHTNARPFEFALGIGAFGATVSSIVHDWVNFLIDHGVIVPFLLALAVVWGLVDNLRSRKVP